MKNLFITVFFTAFVVAINAKDTDFDIAKGISPISEKEQSLVYALPQTFITINVEVTKTIVKKGAYADYAFKYLNIANVPMWDTESFKISKVQIVSTAEADPAHYYTVTYRTYPENLNSLLVQSNRGLLLDFANSWQRTVNRMNRTIEKNDIFDPKIIEDLMYEKSDTSYKIVRTDSTVIKTPIIKKKILVKTQDDLAKELAHELTKLRKRKLKTMRGEYDYHPDAATLKVMKEQMDIQEAEYLAMFAGERFTETYYYSFAFVPTSDMLTKELCYFSAETGVKEIKTQNTSALTLYTNREQEPPRGVMPENTRNKIYMRIPVMTDFVVKLDATTCASARVPVYQFGQVQALPLK